MWYECEDCPFGTNSRKNADKHERETGHDVEEEFEEMAFGEDDF